MELPLTLHLPAKAMEIIGAEISQSHILLIPLTYRIHERH